MFALVIYLLQEIERKKYIHRYVYMCLGILLYLYIFTISGAFRSSLSTCVAIWHHIPFPFNLKNFL